MPLFHKVKNVLLVLPIQGVFIIGRPIGKVLYDLHASRKTMFYLNLLKFCKTAAVLCFHSQQTQLFQMPAYTLTYIKKSCENSSNQE